MLPNNKNTFLLGLIISSLFWVSHTVSAACAWGVAGKEIISNISFGNVIVQRDYPAGAFITSAFTGQISGGSTLFRCTQAWNYRGVPVLFTRASSFGNTIYETNIPGIGIEIHQSLNNVPFSKPMAANASLSMPDPLSATLIKLSTGSVGAGNLTTGTLAYFYAEPEPKYRTTLALTGTNTIIPVACTLMTKTVNVKLDNAVISDFKGKGTTAKPKDFTIDLNCDAKTKIKLSLEGTSAGPAGVLALTAGKNQASGIGIQILKGTQVVALGKQLNFGTANAAGLKQLAFTARYYQTAANIESGTANTTATFTMTYN